MAKKKKKNKKRSSEVNNPKDFLENEDGNSITSRLEKAKSADPFEGLTPEKHVDQIKEQVISSTKKQASNIELVKKQGFPWVEFLIGFLLGGALLVVMFVFHINFAKNVNERIVDLENRLAMLAPAIVSPNADYMAISTRQRLFEAELNRFKRKLTSLIIEAGSVPVNIENGKKIQGKVIFKKNYLKKPIIFFQLDDSEVSYKIKMDEQAKFFEYEITADKSGVYTLLWFAVSTP